MTTLGERAIGQGDLGLRLRIQYLRRRSATQVPGSHRTYTRGARIDLAGSIRSARMIEVLSHPISLRGTPKALHSDNDPEFVSTRLLQWASDPGLQLARAGKTVAEQHRQELQQQISRRVPVHGILSQPC